MHSTNYVNTFIQVAEDCRAGAGAMPPEKHEKTVARLQYELLHDRPYQLTSDDLLFRVYALRVGVAPADEAAERARFFSKGQPCLRASPLAKTYGWGFHCDSEGRVALVACETDAYARLAEDSALTQLKAMRSAR